MRCDVMCDVMSCKVIVGCSVMQCNVYHVVVWYGMYVYVCMCVYMYVHVDENGALSIYVLHHVCQT